MAIKGNWVSLISIGALVGAGFAAGTYLTKAIIGAAQNLTGFSPPLASYAADWDAGLPGEAMSIPYQSYAGSYNLLNELPYVPWSQAQYQYDF